MEDFVSYELAVKLKKKGFREKCFATYSPYSRTLKFNEINADERPASYKLNIEEFRECYNYYKENNIDAPTISHVLRWLREKKKIFILIGLSMCGYRYDVQNNIRISRDYADMYNWDNVYLNGEARFYKSYEQAALAGIEYALDNLI